MKEVVCHIFELLLYDEIERGESGTESVASSAFPSVFFPPANPRACRYVLPRVCRSWRYDLASSDLTRPGWF